MVELINTTFGYKKSQLLFKDLSLNLTPGHIYGLLGKNGVGKTSLLKNIAGLTFPISGTCRVNGYNPADRNPQFLQHIFYLPEEIFVPDTHAKGFFKDTAPFYPNVSYEEYNQYLLDFEVPHSTRLTKLSLGQQKKVMIAFAVACNTPLLIMDEPTNGLDIPSKARFRKIIASAFREDRCILISTHQVKDLENLIDSILILNKQRIALNKSTEELSAMLNFGNVAASSISETLYYEETYKGVQAISEYKQGLNSKLDLELLFNGIVSENQSLINHFNH